MGTVVVVGTQWGDEGKGKITDFSVKVLRSSVVIKVATMQGIPFTLKAKCTNYA